MPTAIASDSARQRWTRARLSSPEIQGESPGGGRGPAVERHRHLQGDQRQAGAGVLAEGLVEQARRARLLAGGERRPRRRRRGGSRARARRPSRWGRRRRSRPARSRPRGSPRRRAAGAPGGRRARASRTSSPRPGPRRAPRQSASAARSACRPPELGVEPLADHLAVADDHRADQRIRADPPPPALGKLQRPPADVPRSVAVSWAFIVD